MSKGALSVTENGVDFININECANCNHDKVCKYKEKMNKAWEELVTNSIANVPVEIRFHCKYASYSCPTTR